VTDPGCARVGLPTITGRALVQRVSSGRVPWAPGKLRSGGDVLAPASSASMGHGCRPQQARGDVALPRDRRQAPDDGEHSGEATASGVPLPCVAACLPSSRVDRGVGCQGGGRTWSHLSACGTPVVLPAEPRGAEPREGDTALTIFLIVEKI
jgi:hypothetical protein